MRGSRAAVAVAVAAMVASLTAACSDPEHDGVVADARPAQVAGMDLWAQLPTGRVTVTVGDPVRTIPGDEVAGGKAIDAAGDREFRPVRVAYVDLEGAPASAPQDPSVDPAELTTLTLHVGDGAYRLPFSGTGEASYLEVAKTSGADFALDVEFDGVVQSVDAAGNRETGAAAGLYDAGTGLDLASCGEQEEDTPAGVDPASVRTCRYDLWEYPYVEGLGWASARDPEATWVVATAQTWLRADQIQVDGRPCRAAAMGGTLRVRVDGQPQTAELPVDANRRAGGHGLGARGAFLLPAADQHELEVTSTWGCRLGDRSEDVEMVDRVSAPS
ncbi:hypothetical protein [Nocardioides humi]|uniref:Uncharacterized protein n=1 Tax=Nocardioides humi TaxID=449461 RepID=A0ABN2BDM3_9ACTN|nr:hypothetical protein [Nocardioides humi]